MHWLANNWWDDCHRTAALNTVKFWNKIYYFNVDFSIIAGDAIAVTEITARAERVVLLSVVSVCDLVCLFVRQHDNSWIIGDIIMNFSGHHPMMERSDKFKNGCIKKVTSNANQALLCALLLNFWKHRQHECCVELIELTVTYIYTSVHLATDWIGLSRV